MGAALVDGELTGYLADRMRVIEHRKNHAELAGVDVVPPIVIVGQGRTGTTILHELLAMDPASRVPLTWEVDHPVPPPETATYETDPRIAEVDATLAGVDLVLPNFRQMHPMGAQLPQECVRITGSDFRSMIFPTQYRVPSYGHLVDVLVPPVTERQQTLDLVEHLDVRRQPCLDRMFREQRTQGGRAQPDAHR